MQTVEKNIGYTFSRPELLELALTHPSRNGEKNNQRLEFLGDAVLSLLISELVYKNYPAEQEGELARRHAALVCGPALAHVARDIDLGSALNMTAGERQAGGATNPTNLEDAMEALIGAMYMDGGIEAARQFVLSHWIKLAEQNKKPPKDAKTALQEWVQAQGLSLPVYNLLETRGSAHAPIFTIELVVHGYNAVQAEATSKRKAEQLAAEKFLASCGVQDGS